jgi:hypothetical protein
MVRDSVGGAGSPLESSRHFVSVAAALRIGIRRHSSCGGVEAFCSGGVEGGAVDGAVAGGVEGASAGGLHGVLETRKKLCVMEGLSSVARPPLLESPPMHVLLGPLLSAIIYHHSPPCVRNQSSPFPDEYSTP